MSAFDNLGKALRCLRDVLDVLPREDDRGDREGVH